LRKGDTLEIGNAAVRPVRRGHFPLQLRHDIIRVTDGPQHSWFNDRMDGATYRVAEDSNRMGLRLEGPKLECARELLTEGVSLGAIQVPREGQPIITFVEHQTTGGYPKIANVISADLPAVGQLRPRDEVRFETISRSRALELLRRQEASLCSLT
jgi:allophanate hydrolase subunit 2